MDDTGGHFAVNTVHGKEALDGETGLECVGAILLMGLSSPPSRTPAFVLDFPISLYETSGLHHTWELLLALFSSPFSLCLDTTLINLSPSTRAYNTGPNHAVIAEFLQQHLKWPRCLRCCAPERVFHTDVKMTSFKNKYMVDM